MECAANIRSLSIWRAGAPGRPSQYHSAVTPAKTMIAPPGSVKRSANARRRNSRPRRVNVLGGAWRCRFRKRRAVILCQPAGLFCNPDLVEHGVVIEAGLSDKRVQRRDACFARVGHVARDNQQDIPGRRRQSGLQHGMAPGGWTGHVVSFSRFGTSAVIAPRDQAVTLVHQ